MRIKAMSNLDRMIELASHGTSRAQGQVPAERELKESPSVPLKKYSNSGDIQGKHDMKVSKHDGVPGTNKQSSDGDTYNSAPIQDRRRDASKDRPNTDYKSKYPNSKKPMEAVGEFAEPLYTLQDELGLEDNILVDELARWMDGQDITEFVENFRRHHEMNGEMEESLEEDSNKELALKDWYQNWSHHTGGNGDELPKGWFKAELDSGITTDGIEQSELDMNWEEDRLPITDAMKDDFKSIMGNDDEETLRIAYDICRELWEAVTEAKAKPDFADIDKDGDKDEDMKKAAKDMKKEELDESPTMDTTQLINLMKNSGLSEEAIETKLTEWANTPDGAAEEEATSHGEPYENFAQSVNLSLKRYLDAEDMKVGLKEHKVDDIKEAYKKSKGE